MNNTRSTAGRIRLAPPRRSRGAECPATPSPAREELARPRLSSSPRPAIGWDFETGFGIPASTPIGTSLAEHLDAALKAYCKQHRKCRAKCSEEAVHELRISIRRLLAQLALIECLAHGEDLERTRRALKKRLKELGELRDTHVRLVFVRAHLERFPELDLLERHLEKRERKLVKLAGSRVRRLRLKKLCKWVRRISNDLTAENETPDTHNRRLTAVGRAARRAFEAVVKRREAVDSTHPATIHRTRIAFKKYRYMVETLSALVPGLKAHELRPLASYQRRMGRIQDLEVFQEMANEYARHTPRAETVFVGFNAFLAKARREAVRRFLARADQLYALWPPGRRPTTGIRGSPVTGLRFQVSAEGKVKALEM